MKFTQNLLLVLLVAIFSPATSQICTGSLGDPVVNITFGTGQNPGGALKSQLPNLSYTSTLCPNDGFYTIVNNTFNCFDGSWHIVNEDHTPGDQNGYMMLINASLSSGVFYVDTVRGLCGGTTYEFAAWVLNVLRSSSCAPAGISPDLTFSIESTTGTVLGTYNTGSIKQTETTVWSQFGLFFKTPPNGSNVVLRITNTAPGGCGNDLALDDITFRACGPTVSTSITGNPATAVDYCLENLLPIPLTAIVSNGYNNAAYQWQVFKNGSGWTDIPGANTLAFTHQPAGGGIFRYRLVAAESVNIGSANCRIASNEITLTIHPMPGAGASGNSPVCTNDSIRLQGVNAVAFSWKGPNNFTSTKQNPVLPASLAAAGSYIFTASDEFGCKGKDTVDVVINQSPAGQITPFYYTCANQAVQLTASGGTNYSWFPGTGLSATDIANPVATLSDTVAYKVLVANAAGCIDTAFTTVFVVPASVADAGPDKFITEGQSVVLAGAVSGGTYTFNWTPTTAISSTNTLMPTVNPNNDITYTLNVQSVIGCGNDADSVFVRVYKKVIVPNAFSPNGDGINDRWRIEALFTYPESETSVFDRYGKSVFKSRGYNTEWDGNYKGKPVPIGTYYYIIDLKNKQPVLKGSVFIIR